MDSNEEKKILKELDEKTKELENLKKMSEKLEKERILFSY
jgi:hypothetical protein